jgi:hypothetical protein
MLHVDLWNRSVGIKKKETTNEMTEQKEPKMSAVAIMENWKVSVNKEMAVAAEFEENWGFLKATPDETKVLFILTIIDPFEELSFFFFVEQNA